MCEMKIRRRFRHKIIGEADVLSSEFCSYCHSSVCVFWASVTRLYPNWFDWPVAKLLNDSTRKHPLASKLAFGAAYPTLEGMILVSLGWYCWFAETRSELRAGLANRQRRRCRLCGGPRTFLAPCNASNTQANFQSESATPSARCLR